MITCFSQEASVLPATSAMLCMFMQAMGIPLSWHKLQLSIWVFLHRLGSSVFCWDSTSLGIKALEALGHVQDLSKNPRLTKKDLERFISLALWATILFPVMQSILHTFHRDLFSPAATNYSIPPERWHELPHYLSPTMQFLATPPGTGLPLHSTLLAARHQALHSLQDLQKIKVSDPCMWVGVSSQSSSTRKSCGESLRILGIFAHWLLHISPFRSVRPPLVH